MVRHSREKLTRWYIKINKAIYKRARSVHVDQNFRGTCMVSGWKYSLLSVCLCCSKHNMRKWFLEMGWRREGQLWISICYRYWTKRSNFWVIDLKAFWTWSLRMLLALAAVHLPTLPSHGRTLPHCEFLQQSSTTWDILGIYLVSIKYFFFIL